MRTDCETRKKAPARNSFIRSAATTARKVPNPIDKALSAIVFHVTRAARLDPKKKRKFLNPVHSEPHMPF
ncbi:MAG: DUF3175 domain-containing protein [Clostridiales bacterium]|nr:DUF3175 domain-containing protein [Clostridiales bacterium]